MKEQKIPNKLPVFFIAHGEGMRCITDLEESHYPQICIISF